MDFDQLSRSIKSRTAEGGGYSHKPGGPYRADATAWAILALSTIPAERAAVQLACDHLAATQAPDGRVPLVPEIAAAYWPTPIAVLAWKKASCCQGETGRALNFIAGNSGLHFEREKNAPYGHDTAIRGWSWIEGTHSWIEPTSLSILALRATGHARDSRTFEAVSMIMNRQLPSGGWNYGNTTVFGQELLPMPEHTGQALCAVSGYVSVNDVRKSIEYLDEPTTKFKDSVVPLLESLRPQSLEDRFARAARIKYGTAFRFKSGMESTTQPLWPNWPSRSFPGPTF